MDDLDVVQPHCWQAFLQSNLTTLGEKLSRRPRRNDVETRCCSRDHAAATAGWRKSVVRQLSIELGLEGG